MKILYLDFDGVIFTGRSQMARSDWNKTKGAPPDPTTCNFLESLCHHSEEELKLVISSSWRFDEEATKEVLAKANLLQYLHEDWRTITYTKDSKSGLLVSHALNRGEEIQEWLDRHPEIKEYKILDDYPPPFFSDKQLKNLIECDSADGLSAAGMRRLVNWVTPKEKIGVW